MDKKHGKTTKSLTKGTAELKLNCIYVHIASTDKTKASKNIAYDRNCYLWSWFWPLFCYFLGKFYCFLLIKSQYFCIENLNMFVASV